MKTKVSKLILSFGLVSALLACFQFVSAQTKSNPTTVTDYYLPLPAEYLTVLESVKNRRSINQANSNEDEELACLTFIKQMFFPTQFNEF